MTLKSIALAPIMAIGQWAERQGENEKPIDRESPTPKWLWKVIVTGWALALYAFSPMVQAFVHGLFA